MYRLLILCTFIFASCSSAIADSNLIAIENVKDNELYELRTYHLKFGSSSAPLIKYLDDVLEPSLRELGVNHFMKFNEYGQDEPGKLWVLISYPDESIYIKAQKMTSTAAFMQKSKEYDTMPADKPIFTRYESSLLLAFDGMPQMMNPVDGAGLFELRTYEGYNEDAVRRKIMMFNDEEIELFHKTKLHTVFFGDMISGPYRPTLVYMLGFKDMAERDANWKVFIDHPEWKRMVADPKYANTIINIQKVFLTPMK